MRMLSTLQGLILCLNNQALSQHNLISARLANLIHPPCEAQEIDLKVLRWLKNNAWVGLHFVFWLRSLGRCSDHE